jgi:hypothetical protein
VPAALSSPLADLHQLLVDRGERPEWSSMFEARERTARALNSLRENLPRELPAEGVSILVSGSLGRGDFNGGSDVDWNLLLDGPADPQHFTTAQDIATAVNHFASKEVGREGTFGGLIVSHDLIHRIGGQEDTNANFTRRMLLLLETTSLGPSLAFDRTLRNIIKRYLVEDHGFWRGTTRLRHHVPHFLLNDLTRFWRTMAVDFAYKLRNRQGQGGVMRNLKLRMSRKILFVAGVLACFRCQLDYPDDATRDAAYAEHRRAELLGHVESIFRLSPADIIASVLISHPHLGAAATSLFNSYSQFLAQLADPDYREFLEKKAQPGDRRCAPSFELTREFSEALLSIFFDDRSGIGELTRRYGIF